VAQPIIFRGYKDAIGDGDQGRTGADGNGPLDTTNMPEIASANNQVRTTSFIIYEAIKFTGKTSGAALTFTAGNPKGVVVKQCVVICTNTGKAVETYEETAVLDCDLQAGSSGTGAINLAPRCLLYGSRIDGNTATAGVNIINAQPLIIGNTIWNATVAINCDITGNSLTHIIGNTIYDCTDAIKLRNVAITDLMFIINNHITDCSGEMINNPYIGTAAHPLLISHNRTRDITSGNGDVADWPVFDAVTTDVGDKDTDYEDADAEDFRLKTSAAGVAKGVIPPENIGAYELPAGGGGGGGSGSPGNMSGGLQ
jgi:hypothetical protein